MTSPDCPVCGDPATHSYLNVSDDYSYICETCAERMISKHVKGWGRVVATLRPIEHDDDTTTTKESTT